MQDVERLAQGYQTTFKEMTDLYVGIGLDEKSGLHGALRKAVHNVEEILKQQNNLELNNVMLMMRRHEKDYLARKTDKYVKRMQTRHEEFSQLLARSSLDSELQASIGEIDGVLPHVV